MPLISRDVPAFASGASADATASKANDDNKATGWASDKIPGWIAYDLSAVPAEQRKQALVIWHDLFAYDFIDSAPTADQKLPVDYKIEANTAAGGGAAPTDGWTELASVTGNDRNSRQHLVDLAGANWVRMNVSKSTNPSSVFFDLDVYSAPNGASDSWLLMGDSITFISTHYQDSDIPMLINKVDSTRWPAFVDAAIGGTNTQTALVAFDETVKNFPGQYITLNYGTNDHNVDYKMEDLVQKVIALGKTPVVPHQPWTAETAVQAEAILNNMTIDTLYAKYPEILHGPDLYGTFKGRTDLIPANDIHPNAMGQEVLRQAWADALTK
jgi:hypothetical protein